MDILRTVEQHSLQRNENKYVFDETFTQNYPLNNKNKKYSKL